jgi:hypothetical protein
MRSVSMKKIILIALICAICVVLMLIAIGCVRPIIPGSHVEIVYPAPDAVVPTEFSVLGVAARWSFGIEINTLLFLGTRESHVSMAPSLVELSLDGVPVAHSDGGNHHVFRVTAGAGDHTLGLATPYGKTEIAVHVTDDPPVVCAPLSGIDAYAESVDTLTKALFDFMETSPSFSFPSNENAYHFQKIFLAGNGAFILLAEMKGQTLSACEIRYVAPIDGEITGDDIGNAPTVFSWESASWIRPVWITETGSAGDRFFMVVFDDTTLTVFSVFPGGKVEKLDFPLSDVAPGLAEMIKSTPYPQIHTRAARNVLAITLDIYRTNGPPGHFDILIRGGAAETADFGERYVDGVTPDGDLITVYPASFTGPFDSALIGDEGKISAYLPLPTTDGPFTFIGGLVFEGNRFYPEYPRFEIGPPVPCIDCMKEYVPVYYGVAGDVAFGPDVLKTTLGGREAYFIMKR